ncbi:hypothetical protein ACRALDRAFT_211419 [Sodiomyces alcalophilus JCM 7366]|uniref:uncharacterized protein n=1 Tax=Sodiomyces alcalophilus JCM 7366 TaxID=591952 RepID=UPI0039B619DD
MNYVTAAVNGWGKADAGTEAVGARGLRHDEYKRVNRKPWMREEPFSVRARRGSVYATLYFQTGQGQGQATVSMAYGTRLSTQGKCHPTVWIRGTSYVFFILKSKGNLKTPLIVAVMARTDQRRFGKLPHPIYHTELEEYHIILFNPSCFYFVFSDDPYRETHHPVFTVSNTSHECCSGINVLPSDTEKAPGDQTSRPTLYFLALVFFFNGQKSNRAYEAQKAPAYIHIIVSTTCLSDSDRTRALDLKRQVGESTFPRQFAKLDRPTWSALTLAHALILHFLYTTVVQLAIGSLQRLSSHNDITFSDSFLHQPATARSIKSSRTPSEHGQTDNTRGISRSAILSCETRGTSHGHDGSRLVASSKRILLLPSRHVLILQALTELILNVFVTTLVAVAVPQSEFPTPLISDDPAHGKPGGLSLQGPSTDIAAVVNGIEIRGPSLVDRGPSRKDSGEHSASFNLTCRRDAASLRRIPHFPVYFPMVAWVVSNN